MNNTKKSVMIFEAPEHLKMKAQTYSKNGLMSVSAMCRVALSEWIDIQEQKRKDNPLQGVAG